MKETKMIRITALRNVADWIRNDIESGAEVAADVREEMTRITQQLSDKAYKLEHSHRETK